MACTRQGPSQISPKPSNPAACSLLPYTPRKARPTALVSAEQQPSSSAPAWAAQGGKENPLGEDGEKPNEQTVWARKQTQASTPRLVNQPAEEVVARAVDKLTKADKDYKQSV